MQEHKSTPLTKGKKPLKKPMKEKATPTPPNQEEQEEFKTRNLLPPYIPTRRIDAPPVSIPCKGYATLVAAKISKGMTVL